MLNIQIHDNTPAHMLRAIRAACNELLGETVELRLPTAAVESLQAFADQEQAAALSEQNATPITIVEPLEDNRQDRVPAVHTDEPAEDLDSAGQPWNAELHASTKSKNADGTWKKRRGSAAAETSLPPGGQVPPSVPDAPPPLPPAAPTATAEPIMPKIFALITSQIVTINQAVDAAQAEGYADLGANGLGGAPVEKQLAVLRKLEG